MIKKIIKLIKRILISFLIIYGYNVLISPINMIIPINFVVLSYITILGVPAFLSIVFLSFFIY